MITGIGIDVVELERIEKIWNKYGRKFAEKILSTEELALLPQANSIVFLAGRFAAKEALSKALGTGFSGHITLKDFSITNLPSGQPVATLYNEAKKTAHNIGASKIHISITHGKYTAAAVAVLEI